MQSPFTSYIVVIAPWALSGMALLVLGIVAITNRGIVPTDLLNFLESIIITSTAGGTVTGVSHSIVNGATQRTVLQAEIAKKGQP